MTVNQLAQLEDPTSAPFPLEPAFRQRILVVDDDSMIRRLNTEALLYSGYDVDAADDGDVAWELIQQKNYDLLLTDHQMPKMTGLGLLRKIHAARLSLPVILATGAVPQEELEAHPWLQVEAILLKPYTFDDLLATVRNVLHANINEDPQIRPPDWTGQPLPNRLRF